MRFHFAECAGRFVRAACGLRKKDGGKKRSRRGVYICRGEAEDFAKTFDVNEMNCMEYRYTLDTPVSCRITDKAVMQTIFDALCEVKIGERTDMRATDSEQSLTFVKTDGTTCVIRFEQRNLLYEEDAYQLENDTALWKAAAQKQNRNGGNDMKESRVF